MILGLREKFLIPLVLLVSCGMIALTIVGYVLLSNNTISNTTDNLSREVQGVVKQMEIWLQERETDISIWSEGQVYTDALIEQGKFLRRSYRQGATDSLKQFAVGYPYYEAIFLADLKGQVIASSLEKRLDQDISGWKCFEAVLGKKPYVPHFLEDHVDDNAVFAIATPVMDEGEIVGVLVGTIRVTVLADHFMSHFYLEGGYAILIESDGRVLALLENGRISYPGGSHDISYIIQGDGILEDHEYNGNDVIAVSGKIARTGWVLEQGQDRHIALTNARMVGMIIAVVGVSLVVCVSLVVVILSQRLILKPLSKMQTVVQSLEKGDFKARIDL